MPQVSAVCRDQSDITIFLLIFADLISDRCKFFVNDDKLCSDNVTVTLFYEFLLHFISIYNFSTK